MPPSDAGYVADDLVHFVGSGHAEDHRRNWDILQEVISSGNVRAHRERSVPGFRSASLSRATHRPLSSNERYVASMACFADIPERQLKLHMGKYGSFGIGLSKAHLIPQGVRPVTYVPYGADASAFAVRGTIEEEWDEIAPLVERLMMRLFGGGSHGGTAAEQERIDDWLDFGVLAYIKFFDSGLASDDPKNFYMEREWRSTSNVHFGQEDIATVYVATGFRSAAHAALPAFADRIVELPVG